MNSIFYLTLFIVLIILYFCFISIYNSKFIKENFIEKKMDGPNIIQTWKNNQIPEKYKPFVEKVKKLNPRSKYIFFTDNDIDYFIKNKFPEYYFVYKKFPYKIQKIDFFRYLAIYYYGGVYLDLDIYLYKSLFNIGLSGDTIFPLEYMDNNDKILRDQGFRGLIGNYAFYAPKGSLFLKNIIDNIVKDRIKVIKYKKGFDPQRYVFYKTGPVMVSQTYIDYKNKHRIKIIKPEPFKFGYFGNYGRHYLMGSWKNNSENFVDYKEKIGVLICCFNRPEYLSKTLNSIRKSNMSDTILCIIDDYSSDSKVWNLIQQFNIYNSNCKIIKIRNQSNLGIRYSLKKGWDILYPMCRYLCNIDSDVIVKKNWLNTLKNIENDSHQKLNKQNVIVSGFNCTSSCLHKIVKNYGSFYTKKSIGGINMFFNKSTYKNIIYPIISAGDRNFDWDWEVCKKAENKSCPIVVTKPSVIQHIGIKGLNSSTGKKIRYDIAEDF